MRVLKRLSRFKMCADVKDSLVVKSSFPVLTRDWNKFLFFSGRLTSSTFAQSKQICSFDDGDTQTRSIDLLGVESAHSAIEVKDSQMKPQMRVTPLPIFGAKCKCKPFKRDKSTYRDFVARGRPLRGQKRFAPLAKRSTCSKSTHSSIIYFFRPRLSYAPSPCRAIITKTCTWYEMTLKQQQYYSPYAIYVSIVVVTFYAIPLTRAPLITLQWLTMII